MSTEQDDNQAPESVEIPNVSRRQFLGGAGAAVIGVSAGALAFAPKGEAAGAAAEVEADSIITGEANVGRTLASYNFRVNAAKLRRDAPHPQHRSNGDEARYPNRIGSYTKGLPHNEFGEVSASAYSKLTKALQTGSPADFEAIPLGGPRFQTSPQSGLAFDLEGLDSHAVTPPPAPALASAEEAGEAVELYWMALLRDVHFDDYGTNDLAIAAAADLTSLGNSFKGAKEGGVVTPQSLFRDPMPGTVNGPYMSQFMLKGTPYGSEFVDRRSRVFAEGSDHMTTFANWLTVQNGGVNESTSFDPTRRYMRNGRDLSAWVQMDVLFQAYFNALVIMGTPPSSFDQNADGMGCPPNATNPYINSVNQIGFATFGPPHFAALLCEVATRALKATWFQKWFIQRRLRPEAFGGLVHLQKTQNRYPGVLHDDILNSPVLDATFEKYGTYLHPMAFPEGSPTHPSYTAGHATVAGACVTILKALFDETFEIPNPVQVSADGLSLEPYHGPPLTVLGELHKVCSNIGTGRNIAGVHWRSDAIQSFKLGEKIAIAILEDQKASYNEVRRGFFREYTFTKFDGTTAHV
ncbi:MAG TPA: vanadium-dependent haloperoxidase [Thermoanaerobaculia bacterium]|nr:vanadium-dependent haloperoxidase [Thermoanaerobaculia bacterium]